VSSKAGSGHMCATNGFGWGHRHLGQSIGLYQAGRKNTFSAIWPMPAAFYKRTVTKVMPSSKCPNRVAYRVCAKRPVGCTCHDFWSSTKSEIAREALDRIGKLYDIDRDLGGQPADLRHMARPFFAGQDSSSCAFQPRAIWPKPSEID
jgi:hypothetical protein